MGVYIAIWLAYVYLVRDQKYRSYGWRSASSSRTPSTNFGYEQRSSE